MKIGNASEDFMFPERVSTLLCRLPGRRWAKLGTMYLKLFYFCFAQFFVSRKTIGDLDKKTQGKFLRASLH